MKITKQSKKNLFITLCAYIVAAAGLFDLYRYYVVSDIVSHITIAQKYAAGNYYDAVNGIWGVLISWLMVPFLGLGVEPVIIFKLLNLLLGALAIVGIWLLAKRFLVKDTMEVLLLLISIPAVLSFAFVHTTADLLVLTVLLFFLYVGLSENYYKNPWNAVQLGIIGGVGYFAKHYVFYVLFFYIPLSHVLLYFAKKDAAYRKKIIINFALAFSIFLSISSIWIAAQSIKYGFLTTGTSVTYNRAWMSPESLGHAPEYLGLLEPPNATANSMWEDLTYYAPQMAGYGWVPFDGKENTLFQLLLIWDNILETLNAINKFSLVLGPVILVVSLLYIVKRLRSRVVLLDVGLYAMLFMGIAAGGYLLIRTSDRYIWICWALILILGLHWLNRLLQYLPQKRNYALVVMALFAFTFMFVPVRRLVINVYQDKQLYEIGKIMNEINMQGRIATNANWSNTSLISYYAGTVFLGKTQKDLAPEDLSGELQEHSVDYWLVWGEHAVSNEEFVLTAELPEYDLTIYRVVDDK